MGGYTGSWGPMQHPTKPELWEVVPTPDGDVLLLPDDEVWMRYDLIDLGDWLIARQTLQIKDKIERDGRFHFLSYAYDSTTRQITFHCSVRSERIVPTQTASAFGWMALGALIASATYAFFYVNSLHVIIWRKQRIIQSVLDDPTVPESVKDAIRKQMEEAPGGGLLEPVGELAGSLGLLAVAIVLLLILGGQK